MAATYLPTRFSSPRAAYTVPEIARVGPPAQNVTPGGAAHITIPLSEVDRSVIDAESDGFLRIHHVRGRIVAATIVAPHAGELIGYIASVMRRGGTLADLPNEIFPYPTVAEALRKAGDTYRRSRLERYFALRRRSG
jgi:pyruvate/2-oxoglutarate dehydrogenase complex dihydrolipoamide dehydrogenase (E3) component